MRVIRNCPFFDRATTVSIGGERVEIRPYQIIVWIGLRSGVNLSRRFPAILDTGHTLNLSIRDDQLKRWAGIDYLPEIGSTTLNQRPVLLYRANLALHRNAPGQRDDSLADPFEIELPEGIVVHAPEDKAAPRLPLLGLRALAHGKLKATIDGKAMTVSIRRRWFV